MSHHINCSKMEILQSALIQLITTWTASSKDALIVLLIITTFKFVKHAWVIINLTKLQECVPFNQPSIFLTVLMLAPKILQFALNVLLDFHWTQTLIHVLLKAWLLTALQYKTALFAQILLLTRFLAHNAQ